MIKMNHVPKFHKRISNSPNRNICDILDMVKYPHGPTTSGQYLKIVCKGSGILNANIRNLHFPFDNYTKLP